MARLPIPGSDEGNWGNVLNDFLSQTHATDGQLKDGSIPEAKLSPAVQAKLNAVAGPIGATGPTGATGTAGATGVQGATGPAGVTAGAKLLIASDAPLEWQNMDGVHLSGTNDHTLMEAAINAGPVALSPGTFHISSPITITIENPSIVGQGWSSKVKITNGTNDWAIVFDPPGNGVRGYFSRFEIDGNASNQTGGGGIHAAGSVQSEYHFIHFLNCYDAGLWLAAFPNNAFGHHNKVVSCLFDGTLSSPGLGRGMLVTSSDENYVRSEFQFLGGVAGSTFAIRDQAGLNTYNACVFVGGRNNLGGIELRDGRRACVTNCVFDGVSGDNLFIASSGDHLIQGNTFTSVADQATVDGVYSGINLEYSAVRCVITNNSFDTSASTLGRTRSLIREQNMGGTGVNIIKHNILIDGVGGWPANGYLESDPGTSSLIAENYLGYTFV